jgi:type VI protein secretion system component VasK
MSALPLFLGQGNVDEVRVSWHSPSGSTREVFLVLGAIIAVTSVLLIWALYFRKRRRHHSHHHHHHHHSSSESSALGTTPAESGQESRRRRRRRRRREHRPRNPTLAETGGLPPVRSDSPSEPLP